LAHLLTEALRSKDWSEFAQPGAPKMALKSAASII
jgi:hypothetical protein